MPVLFRRLLFVLSASSQADLRRQVQYLKAENEVLRAHLPGRVRPTPKERAKLVKYARPLGPSIKTLVTVVKPATVLTWIRQADRGPKDRPPPRRRGRPRTPEDIRRLILRIASETGWGYTRILGELKKLGIHVSRSTVANTLRREGLPTGPVRGEATWDQFIKSHAQTLWACDFLRCPTVTLKGVRDAYLLVFVHVASRRAFATGSTHHPDRPWAAAQLGAFQAAAGPSRCGLLTRDRDSKFGPEFDGALHERGILPVRLPHCSPNLNAHVERFIQSVQTECLDRFVVMGTRHLDHLVGQYLEHYNLERPHSGIGHRTPAGPGPPAQATPADQVVSQARLGGTLRHYACAA